MTTQLARHSSPGPAAAAPADGYLVCEECDAVYPGQAIATDAVLRCRRCGATLERGHALPLNGQLGLTLGALTVFLIGSLSPIVTLELKGNHSQASLLEATRLTWESGAHLVALLSGLRPLSFRWG
jgi:paraquat-inducible protein A